MPTVKRILKKHLKYNMTKSYNLKQVSEDGYLIIDHIGEVIKNHNNKVFPALSENIARNLCEDLNYINQKNSGLLNYNISNEVKEIHELLGNNELRESFAYCIIATMMEYQGKSFDLNIETNIQWDSVFRLGQDPKKKRLEVAILKKAKKHLSANWVNLPLNSSECLEDMQDDKMAFVPDEIINELNEIVMNMSTVERFMVDLIYNFMDSFSITLPILWVAGKIDEDYLVDVYWVFMYGINPMKMKEEAYEEVCFLKNRLLYAKIIKWGYLWNDETLPK